MTPEGLVKKKVRDYLKEVGCYWSMPVPYGYGRNNLLDFHGCYKGRFFAIECKAAGGKYGVTPLQRDTIRDILRHGGHVFIITGSEGLDAFKRWVQSLD